MVAAGILYLALTSSALAQEEKKDTSAAPAPPPEEAQRVEQLRKEANETLLRGEFDRARVEFEKILKLVPNDASAQRDAARAAQAAGEFEYAAEALERAHHFESHTADPEVHYLRGEALYTLDRAEEARREHRIAELEIGARPTDRMQKLWLARIYARRNWLVLADGIYDGMWPKAPAKDDEVAFNQADGHLMNKDWDGGERVLRRYLALAPKSIRAREMLAWALEAKGDLDGELEVRRTLAEDEPTVPNKKDYGRALERAAQFRAARDQYGAAVAAGHAKAGEHADETLTVSYQRMRYRTTPELTGGAQFRSDPQAWSWRLQTGGALPLGQRHQLSLVAWHDSATDWTANLPNGVGPNTVQARGAVTALSASALLAARWGGSLVLTGEGRFQSVMARDTNNIVYREGRQLQAGGIAEVDAPLFGIATVNVRGDLNTQWADAPITIHEGGTVTGVTGHLYLFPKSRVVLFDTGGQRRNLSIDGVDGMGRTEGAPRPTVTQTLLWGGVDFNLWSSSTRMVRTESLDERMIRRSYLSDAGILAYRHYEMFMDGAFRIALAPRASIDNGTFTIRKAFAAGRAGVDLHGGFGYDNQRHTVLAQAGGAFVLASSWSSRLMVSYDMARETATGLPGTLHIGWLTYHADL